MISTTLMVESKGKLKSLLMRVKEESKKSGSEFYIQKMKIIASGHITMWQIGGEKNGNSDRFYFLGSRIIVDGDCSHEINRRLLLGRKAMTNLDNILKSRDITLLIQICIVKTVIFPVVMYVCESWTIKKAERQRIDAFELFYWRRFESPLDSNDIKPVNSKGNQS